MTPRDPGMRALSVQQPWAFAVAAGFQTVVNRSRTTNHRGELALYAPLTIATPGFLPTHSPTGRAAAQALQALGGRGNCWNARRPPIGHRPSSCHSLLALGAVIAVVDLLDVCAARGGYTDCDCGPWAQPFQYHLKLGNVRALRIPAACVGRPGCGWTVPEEVEAEMAVQFAAGDGGPAAPGNRLDMTPY